MGIFDRIGRVIRANVNDMVSKAEDPEKVLEQAVIDMKEDLVKLRQGVAQAIAAQKRTEQQYRQNKSEADKWQQRAQLALTKGEETLAREALVKKKSFGDVAVTLKQQLDQQTVQVDSLRRNLTALEGKISEATTKKNMLKARLNAAQANEKLQNTIGNLSTNSSMAAFDRMEEKVLEREAVSQSAGELAGIGEENQWAALEAGSDIEDELAAMKMQLSGASPDQAALPETPMDSQASSSSTNSNDSATKSTLDDELEALRNQLNKN